MSKTSNQDFLGIYINILEELRENGKIFSQQNPELAPYLDLSYRKSNDPETERLIESFAYMFAQVEHKSLMAQNDYSINFIQNIFPELISPLPALTILKLIPEKNSFNKEKNSISIPKNTLFTALNQNNIQCKFSSIHEMIISCLSINKSHYIDSNNSSQNIYSNRRAFVLNLETIQPLELQSNNSIDMPVYIDSDFYSTISIYDAIFSSDKPIYITVDDEETPIVLSRNNITFKFNFDSLYNSDNIIYPLFDFINCYQKYFFFNINLKFNKNIKNKIRIVIPIEEKFDNLSKIGNDFLQSNCIPVSNHFESKMIPIKANKDKDEYLLRVEGESEVDILNIYSIKAYDSDSGESYLLPEYHNQKKTTILKNSKDIYNDFCWASRRNFTNTVKESGSFYVKIFFNNQNVNFDNVVWPDYLFPLGNCKNGIEANYIKPYTEFNCRNNNILLSKVYSLFVPKYSNRPLKHFGNIEILKLLYRVNQEIVSKKIINDSEFEKILEYITTKGNPVRALIKQILHNSNGFKAEESVNKSIWKNQVYFVPEISYKLNFSKKDGIPRGALFFINFLNSYFNFIRDFNLSISFKAELI
jgi:hypothetical protein